MGRTRFAREVRQAQPARTRKDLLAAGVTAKQLRGPRWRRVSHGVYAPAAADNQGPTRRILDVVRTIGDAGVIGGWAAAYIHGADWLDGIDPMTFAPLPIDCLGLKRRSRAELRFRGGVLRADEVVQRHGVRVTCALRTAFDGARWAECLEDALVFVDAMMTQTGLSIQHLTRFADAHPGVTGAEQARLAARLGRTEGALRGRQRGRQPLRQPRPEPRPPPADQTTALGTPARSAARSIR